MSELKFKSAGVRVHVQLIVTTGSTYGPEWTVEALRKQVAEEAVQMLRHRLGSERNLLQIVGEPKVEIVSVVEDRP